MMNLGKGKARNFGRKAFTLIELLVVIAVLGVLATIVLLAVNPGEQLARARDTSRVAAVTQIGRALLANYTAQGGKYIQPSNGVTPFTGTFLTTLNTSQDLKTVPTNPTPGGSATYANCALIAATATNSFQSGWCYAVDNSTTATEGIVYVGLESQLNDSKCTTGTDYVWWAFSTTQGRGGFTCTSGSGVAPALSPTFVP